MSVLDECAGFGSPGATREELDLVKSLEQALAGTEELAGVPEAPLLSVESALAQEQPVYDPERRLPLTW